MYSRTQIPEAFDRLGIASGDPRDTLPIEDCYLLRKSVTY